METVLPKTTPMMLQWEACKKEAGDALLFFRLGDFYECFYEDAQTASKELEITLTQRQNIPMAGIPHHQGEPYIEKLVRRGYNVAIAEQTEDPGQSKGIVKRKVVRIVTPGTLISSSAQEKNNLFFASLSQVGSFYAIAYVDLSTGEFRTTESENIQELLNEIYRLKPAEILTFARLRTKEEKLFNSILESYSCKIVTVDNWHFAAQLCTQTLLDHFGTLSLNGFGLHEMPSSICAAGALIAHLKETLCQTVAHITEIKADPLSHYLQLDIATQRNLELTEALHDGSKKGTLLSIIDHTQTPMGARLMRHWIKQPLLDPKAINVRQEGIATLLSHPQKLILIQDTLSHVRDLERLITRVSAGNASPRDLGALKHSLMAIPDLKLQLEALPSFAPLYPQLDPLYPLVQLIGKALVDEPPLRLLDGRVIREGYHAELDEIRNFSHNSKEWIANYQNQLKESLGIKTLKVGYNRMFGYYIEVTKSQIDKMPSTFERRQTLVNGERYITAELKNYESKILTAEEQIARLESELFASLRAEVALYATQVLQNAKIISYLDCLASFAQCALKHNYCRPVLDTSSTIEIIDGRHPVIEVHASQSFVPNHTQLDHDNRMMLITGPNMAGKSTYIRQVALIVLLAQIGSFVPARSAHIGIVDKIFSRIGANDNLSQGQSTFMVEMTETANILNNATNRSLVILDEIGRGTSTYDGISIAWAVAEFLLTTAGVQAKTLFATHYSELTQLEEKLKGVKNYQVAISETENGIVFLRKIIPGGSDKSYGIHVAQLAGMPLWVIHRAQELLLHLEKEETPNASSTKPYSKQKLKKNTLQLHLFD